MDKKIFVLGDSRTGTTSMHKFFLDHGFVSVHYFVDEVQEIASKDGCDKHEYRHMKEFIETAGFNAFTDYPTRKYFRELRKDYPDAYFILSRRESVAIWKNSMRKFFHKREDVQKRLQKLCKDYAEVNAAIREIYRDAENFVEICIDDGSKVVTPILAEFLQLDGVAELRRLNKSKGLQAIHEGNNK